MTSSDEASMTSGYARYLAAKTTVDDRALNGRVLAELRRLMPAGAPRVLEVGAGHPRPLLPGERPAFLDRESEPPARLQRARNLLHQGLLVGEGQHRLQQEHHLEAAPGQRRDMSLLEAAGKLASQLAGGGQCAGGLIDTQVAAARLRRDHPAGAGHPAAQVEHRDARADPGPVSQPPDLGCPHEALLAHIFARGIAGRLRLPQRRQQWSSLIVVSDQSVPLVSGYYVVTGATDWHRV